MKLCMTGIGLIGFVFVLAGCSGGSDAAKEEAQMRQQMIRKPEDQMTPAEKSQLAAQRKSNLELAAKMAGKDN